MSIQWPAGYEGLTRQAYSIGPNDHLPEIHMASIALSKDEAKWRAEPDLETLMECERIRAGSSG